MFRDKPSATDAPSPPGAVPTSGQTQKVIWVRGDIEAKLVLERVRPEYPYVAKVGRIQGNVRLRVGIGSDARQLNRALALVMVIVSDGATQYWFVTPKRI